MAVMPWVPLMRASPSLASSTSGSRPQRPRASTAGSARLQAHLTFADHGQGEVCERRQVARGAERALLGHDRQQSRLEHLDEALHDLAPHPGVAESQHVRPQAPASPGPPRAAARCRRRRHGSEEAVLQGPGVLRA